MEEMFNDDLWQMYNYAERLVGNCISIATMTNLVVGTILMVLHYSGPARALFIMNLMLLTIEYVASKKLRKKYRELQERSFERCVQQNIEALMK